MYLSALQKITKHAFKIWDTFATIPTTTQVVTLTGIPLASASPRILIIA